MRFAKITSRAQTTIPESIREAADWAESGVITFEVKCDDLAVPKVTPGAG